MNQKEAVENYQCPGCVNGSDFTCFEKGFYKECKKHIPGTFLMDAGYLFLGMPKGFDHVGPHKKVKISICETLSDFKFNSLNIPIWKYLDEYGNTLVKGLSPRLNSPFIIIFLGNFMKEIDCICLTEEFLKTID